MNPSRSTTRVRALTPGAAYRLTAAARREAAPERLIVEADVSEPSGAPVLSMRAVLRLVPLTEGQGA
ncbi:MAG: hypothetical protein U1E19_00525 [Rhodoblastus sp.]